MPAAEAPIIRRRVNIDYASANVAGWVRGRPAAEHALNALSFCLPIGEAYFADSVRHYLGRIRDPELKLKARDFVYQEAVHSKEHARFNEEVRRANGYGSEIEAIVRGLFTFSRRCMPRATQLATTCALEHFTAMFADDVLSRQDEHMAGCEPAFAALWLWHGAEEIEHKAVCFDVYREVVGKGAFAWLHRVVVMAAVSLMGVLALAVGFALIARKQKRAAGGGPAGRAESGAPSVASFSRSNLLKLYLDYYRPSFHPWQHDNSALVTKWKESYADFPGISDAVAPRPTA